MNYIQQIRSWFTKNSAFRIGLIYLGISTLWIFFSDQLILFVSRDLHDITHFQTIKGLIFVGLTTIIIYFLIFKALKQKNQLIETINTSERWYNTLFSNIPKADMYLFDTNMNFILAQGEQIKQNELPHEKIEGKNLKDLSLPRRIINELRTSGQEILLGHTIHREFQLDNTWFELRGSPLREENGPIYAGVIVMFNITNYKEQILETERSKNEAEALYEEYMSINEQLNESNEQLAIANHESAKNEKNYKTFINQTHEGIYRFDLDKPMSVTRPVDDQIHYFYEHAYIAECNDSLAKSYGYNKAEDLMGMSLKQFHSMDKQRTKVGMLRKFIENNYELKNHDTKEYTIKGEPVYFSKNITGIVIDGKLYSAWGAQTNISQQKMFEKNLIEAKKKAEESDRLKSAFLANMSHEIRTPLNGILGFSYLLTKKKKASKDEQKFASIISSNSKQLLHLINDILDLSKIEAGQLSLNEESFPLNTLLDEIYTQYLNNENLKEKGLKLKYEVDLNEGHDQIILDRARLMQVIENLLNNSIKFTKKGEIRFGYKVKDQNTLQFYVQDTGIGIPEDKKEIIFQRFQQNENSKEQNQRGTGLGLAICKGISKLYNGDIWIESEEGKGSTFYLTLPLKQKKQEQQKPSPVSNLQIEDLNILIVEDDPNSYELLSEILKLHNAKVIYAGDGETATELCEKNNTIDLVLMDIKLPGKDGYVATKEIKACRPDLPIIAQTAYAMPEEKEKIRKHDFDGYITKPIEEQALLEMLAQTLP